MGMGQYLLIPFLVGWTSIYQLFWGSLGTRVLTHPHMSSDSSVRPDRLHFPIVASEADLRLPSPGVAVWISPREHGQFEDMIGYVYLKNIFSDKSI